MTKATMKPQAGTTTKPQAVWNGINPCCAELNAFWKETQLISDAGFRLDLSRREDGAECRVSLVLLRAGILENFFGPTLAEALGLALGWLKMWNRIAEADCCLRAWKENGQYCIVFHTNMKRTEFQEFIGKNLSVLIDQAISAATEWYKTHPDGRLTI